MAIISNKHDYERAVLAAVLLGGPQAMAVTAGTMPTDFADGALGAWWRMLLEMDASGLPYTDPRAVMQQLERERFDSEYRTPAFFANLILAGLAAHAAYYAQQVRDAAKRRKLVRIAVQLADKAQADHETIADVRKWLDSQLLGITEDSSEQYTFHEAGRQLIADLRKPREGETARVTVLTGIPAVDGYLGAMVGGELVILAARPRMGKTALATQIAMNAAESGRRVLFTSLEMSQTELAMRVLSARAEVDSAQFRGDKYTDDHVFALENELHRHEGLPLTIWAPTRSGVTISRLRATARLHAVSGLGLVVVDYLQLLDATDPSRPRHEQVGEMTKSLKQLARELKVPVLCLAQLNRTAETEETPRLGHLRESGSIEQDADTVLFVTRNLDTTDARLHVAKHRAGSDGVIELDFDAVKTRFANRGHVNGAKACTYF
jgi:replicative DNA helicase